VICPLSNSSNQMPWHGKQRSSTTSPWCRRSKLFLSMVCRQEGQGVGFIGSASGWQRRNYISACRRRSSGMLPAANGPVAPQGYFLKSTVDAENWAKVCAYRLPSLENRRGKGGFRVKKEQPTILGPEAATWECLQMLEQFKVLYLFQLSQRIKFSGKTCKQFAEYPELHTRMRWPS
jgi:hypothetical protein